MNKKKIVIVLFLIVVICIVIFLGITLRKMNILKEIGEKVSNYQTNDNYYQRTQDSLGNINEYFSKGNRKKSILTSKSNGTNIKVINCSNGEITNTYIEVDGKKNARLDSKVDIQPNNIGLDFEGYSWKGFKKAMTHSIKSAEFNGKQCYYISGDWLKDTYIEKKTGLVLKMTNGMVNNEPLTYEINYEFGNVTDSDLLEPDASEYEIQR